MSETSGRAEAPDAALEEALFTPEPEPVTDGELTIVKIGTDAAPDWETAYRILDELHQLQEQGQAVIAVWSRGVRTGMEVEETAEYPDDVVAMRYLSGTGWPEFVHGLGERLDRRPFSLLVTREDLRNPKVHDRIHEVVRYALEQGKLVVSNEDDVRSDDEFEKVGTIDFLDNDGLARRLAVDFVATRLVIVTDVPGVYDKDPKRHDDARRLAKVPAGSPLAIETTGRSDYGRGGMTSKRDEIELARDAGVEVFVTDATPGRILAAVDPEREFEGTHLEAHPVDA